jgi:hypothetical protein
MGTSTNALPVNTVSSGGSLSSTASNLSTSTVAEPIASNPARTTSNIMYPGGMNIFSFPGTVINFGSNTVTNTAASFAWTTPGYDGNTGGTLQAGSSYFIVITTYTSSPTDPDFAYPFTNGVLIATGTIGTGLGKLVFATASSLMPNSTYFATLFTADNQGDISYSSNMSSFSTLANPTLSLATTFEDIFYTSTTVEWAALLPHLAGESSTMTGEGFELDASSTNFGALTPGGVIYTSMTFNNAASTLTVDGAGQPLEFANTYYFRVGSLNWESVPNYIALQRLNLQISLSTIGVSFGNFNPVLGSTVSISSAQVVNLGNVPVTLQVAGKMTTAGGSPWTLGAAHDVDVVLLQGLWNNATPSAANPDWTSITNSTLTSSGVLGGAYYTGAGLGQNAFEIQPGSSATMWFKFTPPTSTSSVAKETMAIQYTPIYP